MATQNPPYAIQASSHSAELFRRAVGAHLQSQLGGVVNTGDLLVTQTTTASQTVNVAGGFPGGEVLIPGSIGATQGLYYALNDATVNLAIAASNATNPRIDVVYAAVQDAAYSGSTNTWVLGVVTGTPAASPTVPALPSSAVALAQILVPASSTSVVTANITDVRPFGVTPPAGAIYQSGGTTTVTTSNTALTSMTAQFLRGGMTVASNGLTVPKAGIYHVDGTINFSAQVAGTNLSLYASIVQNSATALLRAGSSYDPSGEFPVCSVSGLIQLAAGDNVTLWGQAGSQSIVTQNGQQYTYLHLHRVGS